MLVLGFEGGLQRGGFPWGVCWNHGRRATPYDVTARLSCRRAGAFWTKRGDRR